MQDGTTSALSAVTRGHDYDKTTGHRYLDGAVGPRSKEVFGPRHKSDGPVDKGASSDPRHPQFKPRADAWAGNPDTDKYWSK